MADQQHERRAPTLGDVFMQTVELGIGVAMLTAETAQNIVNDLMNRGQVSREEGPSLVGRLMEAAKQQREQLAQMIDNASERAMERMDVARRHEVDELKRRVAALEQAVLQRPCSEPPVPPTSLNDVDMTLDQE